MMIVRALVFTLCGFLALSGCERRGATTPAAREVVLYCSADDHIARPVVEAFEKETGVRVLFRGDTEATKNTGLAERLRQEKDKPECDVFWSSEVFFTVRLAEEGMLAPHVSATTRDWPKRLTDAEHRWHGMGQRARVAVFNTDSVRKEDAPKSMQDLLDVRFQDRIVMARPQFGTTRGHMAALVALWGEDATRDFLLRLKASGVRLLDGNSAVVRAVAVGEADVGLTDTDDVWAGQRNGWHVDLTYIRHDLADRGVRAGPLMIPNAVSIIRGAPHAKEAAQLADYLLSERVERMLAESESKNVPVRAELAKEFPTLAVPDPMTLGFDEIARSMEQSARLCEELLVR